MTELKLQWLNRKQRDQFIKDWAAWSRLGLTFLFAPLSDVDDRPSRVVRKSPTAESVFWTTYVRRFGGRAVWQPSETYNIDTREDVMLL